MSTFKLRIKMANSGLRYHRSSADDKILHRNKVEKEEQLIVATAYCKKRKRQGAISVNRAINCTRTMAENHLDGLVSERSRDFY